MSEESTVSAQYQETVYDEQDPKNFVHEDEDDVLKVSRKRLVMRTELGSEWRRNQDLDTEARVPPS